jgi:hypothetical protein
MKTRINNNIVKLASLALVLMLMIPAGMAYDSGTPYTVTVNYIVPSDTSFTVTLAGAETTIDFNPATKDSANVEPDSQVAASSIPIATITNTGNLNQNFSVQLTTAQVAWAVVSVSNYNNYATPITLSAVAQSPTGWTAIAADASTYSYMKATFTDAPSGTTSKTLQVNSAASS